MIQEITSFILKCDKCGVKYTDEDGSKFVYVSDARATAELNGWHIDKGVDLCLECVEKMEEKQGGYQ